nr:MAG TPA: hypothetical protein [Caudoviricetes sp.]
MGLKEEVLEMKKEVQEIQEESFATQILHDYKIQSKRLFIIWIITFVTLIGVSCYTLYLLNDIGVETTTTEELIDIDDVDNIENSHIHNR